MTPTMEEVAGWLREAAELAYLVSLRDGGARDKTILSQHYTKKREIFNDRAAQVEAMGQQSDPMLEELAETLERISEDGHAMLSMTIGSRNRLLAALQKYQQSKVQP